MIVGCVRKCSFRKEYRTNGVRRLWKVPRKRFTLKSDQNRAILSLETAASRPVQPATEKNSVMEVTLVRDSQASSLAEKKTVSHSILEVGRRAVPCSCVGFRHLCCSVFGASCRFHNFEAARTARQRGMRWDLVPGNPKEAGVHRCT